MFSNKFKFRSPRMFALMALSLASGLAAADTFNAGVLPQSQAYTQAVSHNGSFADTFNFHLNGLADISSAASLLNLDLGSSSILHVDSPALSLFSTANPGTAIASGFTSVFVPSLGAGDYFVKLTGNANGLSGGAYLMGIYSVMANPVPEPEQWGLFVAGLLAVGATVRRKQA